MEATLVDKKLVLIAKPIKMKNFFENETLY